MTLPRRRRGCPPLSDSDDADDEPLDDTSGEEIEGGSTGGDRPEIEDDERAEVDLAGVTN